MTTDHAIHPLDVSNRARWDAFVRARPEGTFFHLSGWQQVLEQAFGHRTHFLYLEQQGQIEAVLPLAEVKRVGCSATHWFRPPSVSMADPSPLRPTIAMHCSMPPPGSRPSWGSTTSNCAA